MQPLTYGLMGSALLLLSIAVGVGRVLKQQPGTGLDPAQVEQFNARIHAWWLMCAVLAATCATSNTAVHIFFGVLSFWSLREFITLTPTRVADHRTLFWVFFLITPAQYVLVALSDSPRWGVLAFETFSVMIPVYGFLFVPARIALAGDYKRYLERCAKIQAGMMICVYCLSHATALLELELHGTANNQALLFFFCLVTVLGDAFGFLFEKLWGKHPIVPSINPNKSWEGVMSGIASATLLGTAMFWVTPFTVWQTALISCVIATVGFTGGLTMSAIKRDRGVKDYGTLVEGHWGVLDRIDSICFAAPIFYHFTRLVTE
ncbi:MAG: phosphatidate cytidylyltransferase [Planctomycetaceae bacterium]|nr:phosphatidate cytidylyltransferase [Planctomycetaceae bacterium]